MTNDELNKIKDELCALACIEWHATCGETAPEGPMCITGDWNDRIWTISPNQKNIGWENDSDTGGYGLPKNEAEFFAKSPTRIDALVREVERLREALVYCALNPATNKDWTSHDQLIEAVKELNKIAREALEEK